MSFFIWLLLLIHEAAILIAKGNSTAAQKVPRGAGCVRAFPLFVASNLALKPTENLSARGWNLSVRQDVDAAGSFAS